MTPCARGCRTPRRHVPPCTCTPECAPHEDHCGGCAPTEATRGLLCGPCSRRLRAHLGAEECPDGPHGLAWAWDHLAVAYPSLAQWPDGAGPQSAIDDAEAERLAAVITLRCEIRDWLGTTTADLIEHTGRAGPGGVWLTTAWRNRQASHVGRMHDIGRVHVGLDRAIVRSSQAWLLRHVEPLEAGTGTQAASEAVVGVWDGAADLMTRAHALAPWRPPPTLLEGIPCRCHATMLHDHGDEVKCWNVGCQASYTREQYDVLTKVMAHRFRDRQEETA